MPTLTETFERTGVVFKRHGEHHHSGKGWISIDCPRCSPGWNKFRLGFELSTGRSRCWLCGTVDGVQIVSDLCGISLRDSATLLRQSPDAKYTTRTEHKGRLVLPQAGELLPAHRNYLKSRGFDPDEISQVWGVKGIGLSNKLQWRLLIPIHDRRGTIVSWTTRSIGKENSLRYISASSEEESVPHKEILYGAHLAKQSIVIVEGPLDAWSIGPGGVATLGVGYTQEQLWEMVKFSARYVCFDSQEDAQIRAEELCRELSAFPGAVENIVLETGKDPAEADKAEIRELRQKFL